MNSERKQKRLHRECYYDGFRAGDGSEAGVVGEYVYLWDKLL